MTSISFAVISGFYFWIGPLGIILAIRSFGRRSPWPNGAIIVGATAFVSFCVTTLLAYCVKKLLPDSLPEAVLDWSFAAGWCYLFLTSLPALLLYALATVIVRSPRRRFAVGFVAASIPYVLLLCWYLPLVATK